MTDGRLTRLAVLLFVLLLAPVGSAATPSADRTVADSAGGQEITDLAIDPTGQFVAAVVMFDAAKTSAPTLPLPGQPATPRHDDIYLCDYGAAERPTSGTGCRGVRQQISLTSGTPTSLVQQVDATTVDVGGRAGRYAVVGPDNRISLWSHTSDQAVWTAFTENGKVALNVSIAREAARVFVGAAPATTGGGALEVHFGNNGTLAWSTPLRDEAGADVRPNAMAYARRGGVLAIGTAGGVLLYNPDGQRPTTGPGMIPQADGVSDVALSAAGDVVAATGTNGVFFAQVIPGVTPNIPSNSSVYNSDFPDDAQAVALTLDGTRFAAAAGDKLYFFRRTDTASIAQSVGQPFQAAGRISDIAYDEKGLLLVAIAGNTVYGFGPNKNTPVWSFDATQSAFGSVDGPLRRVAVSDDATRVIVAGRTKTMAYSSVVGATASINTTTGSPTITPTQTLGLDLTLKNTGSVSDNYSFVVSTPVGWQPASADGIQLDPEQTSVVRFNVTAPIGAAPGQYGVQVRVRSQVADELAQRRNTAPQYLAGPSFNLTIPRSVVLKVEAPDDRLLLRQGADQTVPVVLRNEGNAEGVVNLSTRQELTRGSSWDIRFDGGDQVRVPASGSLTVNMIVAAPSESGSGDRNVITIRAREGETVEATDQIIAYVDAQFGSELRTNKTNWEFYPGQSQILRLNVTNIGNTEDSYNLSASLTPIAVASDWRVTFETPQVTVARGQTKAVTVTVRAVASDAREATLTLRSESQSSPDRREDTLVLNLVTIPRPPTDDDKDDRLVPGPAPVLAALVVAVAALARRVGGRR